MSRRWTTRAECGQVAWGCLRQWARSQHSSAPGTDTVEHRIKGYPREINLAGFPQGQTACHSDRIKLENGGSRA